MQIKKVIKKAAAACLILCYLKTMAQHGASTTAIITVNSGHIAAIGKDTITIITGSTYRYNVDTPEDKGLVLTNLTTGEFLAELLTSNGTAQKYVVKDKTGVLKTDGLIVAGDRLMITSTGGEVIKTYCISTKAMALGGQLTLAQSAITINASTNLTLNFKAGQRSPDASVTICLPKGVYASMDNTTVNVIGRGDVMLKNLSTQSIGRTGTHYSYNKVGDVTITGNVTVGQTITFTHLDLRPDNGTDLKITINNIRLKRTGKYVFKSKYTTSQPEQLTSPGTGTEVAVLAVTNTITDFVRVAPKPVLYMETPQTYSSATFNWGAVPGTAIKMMQSADGGIHWKPALAVIKPGQGNVTVSGLLPDQHYAFRLLLAGGPHKGASNIVHFYSGKVNISKWVKSAIAAEDNTDNINQAISYLNSIGGGTLYFGNGIYMVRTIHLKSNVYLYIDKGATLQALKGNDAPETTWFCDRKYRSGLSPTDMGPYADPENYMTKQDVGHQYFHNAMFFGERVDNIKIIGNGRITGDGNLVNGDKVMNNAPDNRADKIFALKLCTNIEIGGLYRKEDMWYDADKDEPYYIGKNGAKLNVDNMLNIDRSGHFVLLATGSDSISVHDTYMGRQSVSNTRDIYDFMGCNNVNATNIYVTNTSDDIIKLGSDCSLGFTRPARNYRVRNIVGDTNCNLVQLGSETADDITDVYVDNIYVLGSNKAGFSISVNDGGHINNVKLNSGYTGSIHTRSKMYRCTTPFFISISNRGRVIGADAARYIFSGNEKKHGELLVKNVNIGGVENVSLNGLDVYETYGGSSYNGKRWQPYNGSQKKASAIIAGYKLPDAGDITDGLDFRLPNDKHTGYVKNITLNGISILVKGGNGAADTAAVPPEMGVGQYNIGDLKVQPAYGLWARHVDGLTIKKSNFNYEKRDSRYALFFDDVKNAELSNVKVVRPNDNNASIALKNASDIRIDNFIYFQDLWGSLPAHIATKNASSRSMILKIPQQ
ncbi:endopygalactorunase [Mucilaginibacter sp. HMF5004]|uniref:endopygalactorunase n=1 Tax=Mucilaginibacter rivuli TaxID=2857527 RepID=UPI001C5D7470|nr:endopygalactorunase [Mucilaginibacter rivuli]MBW4889220.1 endopygalactorunase [Mucilaginibacter rivuli]